MVAVISVTIFYSGVAGCVTGVNSLPISAVYGEYS